MKNHTNLTENTTKEADDFRVRYMLDTFPRPWKIVLVEKERGATWGVVDAEGRRVYLSGRGALALVVEAVNGFES